MAGRKYAVSGCGGHKRVDVTAPTGVAALNVGGMTIRD